MQHLLLPDGCTLLLCHKPLLDVLLPRKQLQIPACLSDCW
jgi:hypothetical protein